VIDEEPTTEPKKKPDAFWRELPILLGVAIVVAVVVRAFVLQTFYIPSESMQHTLEINDRVLVNKLVYDFRDPRRGEIVVFKAPESWRSDPSGEDFIKRVIGVPGDHVVCCDDHKRLIINGYSLDEPYLLHDGDQQRASPDDFDITVPAGRLWVMGDNRYHSGDSRDQYLHGSDHDIVAATIPMDAVVGRAFVLFWPFSHGDWLSVPDEFSSVPDPPRS
jgi:signal peptidase I